MIIAIKKIKFNLVIYIVTWKKCLEANNLPLTHTIKREFMLRSSVPWYKIKFLLNRQNKFTSLHTQKFLSSYHDKIIYSSKHTSPITLIE